MALSPQVVEVLVRVVERFKTDNPGKSIRVGCLGYPDILLPLESFKFKDQLVARTDSEAVTKFHGRGSFQVPTAESFFEALGCQLTVLDIKQWRGNEVIIDLNRLIDVQVGPFDILIDNGTIEHCFNIPMAIWNIRQMLRQGSYVIHWNPHHMPNHGFYNLSATFFYDWYMANGGELVDQSLWNFEVVDGKTTEVPYAVPSTKRFNFYSYNNSLLTVAQITAVTLTGQPVWPTQSKYVSLGILEESTKKNEQPVHEKA